MLPVLNILRERPFLLGRGITSLLAAIILVGLASAYGIGGTASAATVADAPAQKQEPEPAKQAYTAAQAAPVVDSGWAASVSGWLASRKTYPEAARLRGEEGRVAVRFTVDRSGRVMGAAIVSSSGSALLDEAALGLLRQAVLPAFPADMTQASITITTTMRYSLVKERPTSPSTEGRYSKPATAGAATVAADPSSNSYQKGSADRDAWETWFNGLTGSEKDGATYWTGQRSLQAPSPCNAHASNGNDWLSGCTEARRRLTPIDIGGKTDSQYWNGWNRIGVTSSVAQNQEADPNIKGVTESRSPNSSAMEATLDHLHQMQHQTSDKATQQNLPREVNEAVAEAAKECRGPPQIGFVRSFNIRGILDAAYLLDYTKGCKPFEVDNPWCGTPGCRLVVYAKTDDSAYRRVLDGYGISAGSLDPDNIEIYSNPVCDEAGSKTCRVMWRFNGISFVEDNKGVSTFATPNLPQTYVTHSLSEIEYKNLPMEVMNEISKTERICAGPAKPDFVTSFTILGLHDPAYLVDQSKACINPPLGSWCNLGGCGLTVYAKPEGFYYRVVFGLSVGFRIGSRDFRIRNDNRETELEFTEKKYPGQRCQSEKDGDCLRTVHFNGLIFTSYRRPADAVAMRPLNEQAQQNLPVEVRKEITEAVTQCDGKMQPGFVTSFRILGLPDPAYLLSYGSACSTLGVCGSGGCLSSVYAKTDSSPYHPVLRDLVRGLEFRNVNGRTQADIAYHGSVCDKAGFEECPKVLQFDGQKFVGDGRVIPGSATIQHQPEPTTSELSATQRGMIGAHVRPCWTKDAATPATFSIMLNVVTDATGTVRAATVANEDQSKLFDHLFSEFAERAVRAVMDVRCATLPLPNKMLGHINNLTFRFSP